MQRSLGRVLTTEVLALTQDHQPRLRVVSRFDLRWLGRRKKERHEKMQAGEERKTGRRGKKGQKAKDRRESGVVKGNGREERDGDSKKYINLVTQA